MPDEKISPRAAEKRPMEAESASGVTSNSTVAPENYFTVILPTEEELSAGKGKQKADPEDSALEQEKAQRQAEVNAIVEILAQEGAPVHDLMRQIAEAVPIITQHSFEKWRLLEPLMMAIDVEIRPLVVRIQEEKIDNVKQALRNSLNYRYDIPGPVRNNYQSVLSEFAERNIHLFFAEQEALIQPSEREYLTSKCWTSGFENTQSLAASLAAPIWKTISQILSMDTGVEGKIGQQWIPPTYEARLLWTRSLENLASQLFPDLSEHEKTAIREFESSMETKVREHFNDFFWRDSAVRKAEHQHREFLRSFREQLRYANQNVDIAKPAETAEKFEQRLGSVYWHASKTHKSLLIMKQKLEDELQHRTLDPEENRALKICLLAAAKNEVLDQRVNAFKAFYNNAVGSGFLADEDPDDPFVVTKMGRLLDMSQAQKECSDAVLMWLPRLEPASSLLEMIDDLKEKHPLAFTPPPLPPTEPPPLYDDQVVPQSISKDQGSEPLKQAGLAPDEQTGTRLNDGGESSDTTPEIPALSKGLLVDDEEKPIEDKSERLSIPSAKDHGKQVWKPAESASGVISDLLVAPENYFTVILPTEKGLFFRKGKQKENPEDSALEQVKAQRQDQVDAIEEILAKEGVPIHDLIRQIAEAAPIITQHSFEKWRLLEPLMMASNAEISSLNDRIRQTKDDGLKQVLRNSLTDYRTKQQRIKQNYESVLSEFAERNVHLFHTQQEEHIQPSQRKYLTSGYRHPQPLAPHVWQTISQTLSMDKKEVEGKIGQQWIPPTYEARLLWTRSLENLASQLFPDLSEREKTAIRHFESFTETNARKCFNNFFLPNSEARTKDRRARESARRSPSSKVETKVEKGITAEKFKRRITAEEFEQSLANAHWVYSREYKFLLIMKQKLENELQHRTLDPEENRAFKMFLLAALKPYFFAARSNVLNYAISPKEDPDDPFMVTMRRLRDVSVAQKECSYEAWRRLGSESASLLDMTHDLQEKYPLTFTSSPLPPPLYEQVVPQSVSKDQDSKPLKQADVPPYEQTGTLLNYGGESSNTKPEIPAISKGLLVPYEEKPIEDKPGRPSMPFAKGHGAQAWKPAITTDHDIKAANAEYYKKEQDKPRLMRLGDVNGNLLIDDFFHSGKDFFLASARLPNGEKVSVAILHSECVDRIGHTPTQIVEHIEKRKRNKEASTLTLKVRATHSPEASTSAEVSRKPKPPGL
ncbi:MAG TPA: hypothetical protein VM532_06620 [Burkholderiales bacterium]|nr:hypothetical protein [Burkholderiales bacterium]